MRNEKIENPQDINRLPEECKEHKFNDLVNNYYQ